MNAHKKSLTADTIKRSPRTDEQRAKVQIIKFRISTFISQRLMVTTLNGRGGLTAVSHVEEGNKTVQEPAPIHIQNTAERIATSWDRLQSLWNVTQTPVVSTLNLVSLFKNEWYFNSQQDLYTTIQTNASIHSQPIVFVSKNVLFFIYSSKLLSWTRNSSLCLKKHTNKIR